MTNLRNIKTHRLELTRETVPVAASLVLIPLANNDVESMTALLHDKEKSKAQALKMEQRRHAYILGRAAAKCALSKLVSDQDMNTILVENGIFGQPVVVGVNGKNIQVSISHCGDWGAALAFFEHHPMGIDLERIDQSNVESILSQCTEREKVLINESELPLDEACAMFWSMKESLSKILRSGLMSPLDTYEIDSINMDGGYQVALFSRFAQYRSVSFRFHGMRCAVTLPRKTLWLTPIDDFLDS